MKSGKYMILVLLLGMSVISGCIGNFMRAKNRASITACKESLVMIKIGVESQIAENGSLKGIKSVEDVCNNVLAGYETSKECKNKGLVTARVDKVCTTGSLKFVVDAKKMTYEITAKAKDKSGCPICVTEKKVSPEEYDKCPGACEH